MIQEKIIEDISECLHIDAHELEYIFSKAKILGYLGIQEAKHLISMGIPLISMLTNIMRMNPEEVGYCIKNGKIPFYDLCVMLGIFGQDIMARKQNKVIDSYSQK